MFLVFLCSCNFASCEFDVWLNNIYFHSLDWLAIFKISLNCYSQVMVWLTQVETILGLHFWKMGRPVLTCWLLHGRIFSIGKKWFLRPSADCFNYLKSSNYCFISDYWKHAYLVFILCLFNHISILIEVA